MLHEVHQGKAKIPSHGLGRPSATTNVELDSSESEVLSHGESTVYLGEISEPGNTHDTALEHRLNKAWAKLIREFHGGAVTL